MQMQRRRGPKDALRTDLREAVRPIIEEVPRVRVDVVEPYETRSQAAS